MLLPYFLHVLIKRDQQHSWAVPVVTLNWCSAVVYFIIGFIHKVLFSSLYFAVLWLFGESFAPFKTVICCTLYGNNSIKIVRKKNNNTATMRTVDCANKKLLCWSAMNKLLIWGCIRIIWEHSMLGCGVPTAEAYAKGDDRERWLWNRRLARGTVKRPCFGWRSRGWTAFVGRPARSCRTPCWETMGMTADK